MAEQIKPTLTQGNGAPLAQQALRWILDHDAVTAVIPGASKVSQVESNAAAADLPKLGARTHEHLRQLYRDQIHSRIQGKY